MTRIVAGSRVAAEGSHAAHVLVDADPWMGTGRGEGGAKEEE